MLNLFPFYALSLLQKILFCLFIVTTMVQLYYYLKYFLKLAHYRGRDKKTLESLSVSVVVAAKNEAKNLKKLIPALLKQEKVDLELLIVDDYSEDETPEVIRKYQEQLTFIQNKGKPGKKNALKVGIEAAKNEYLIFTDADCLPCSDKWLFHMANSFNEKKEIVLGYGGFYKKNSLLNKIIRFEASLVACQYFAFALNGKPYMGVGRNLAYTGSIYKKSKSFIIHAELLSGDDDLLINEMGNDKNAAICIRPEAHTYSEAEANWKKFILQKRRQLQAGNNYKTSHRFLLGLFGFSNLLYYVLLVSMLTQPTLFLYILGIFVLKQLLEYYLFNRIFQKFRNQDLVKWTLFLEPVYLIFIAFVGVSTWLWKVNKWK